MRKDKANDKGQKSMEESVDGTSHRTRQAAFCTQPSEAWALPRLVEQQLRARGENPEDFRQLHRDLIGYLRPDDARGRVIVETLAETWWVLLKTGQLNEMHAASLLFSTGYAKIGQTNVWH
jgi:hypothetical protein